MQSFRQHWANPIHQFKTDDVVTDGDHDAVVVKANVFNAWVHVKWVNGASSMSHPHVVFHGDLQKVVA